VGFRCVRRSSVLFRTLLCLLRLARLRFLEAQLHSSVWGDGPLLRIRAESTSTIDDFLPDR